MTEALSENGSSMRGIWKQDSGSYGLNLGIGQRSLSPILASDRTRSQLMGRVSPT
jgi:hypothetical protein